MNKTLMILRQEIYSLVSRFSFWFGVLGVPIIAFMIYGGIAWINSSQGIDESTPGPMSRVNEIFNAPAETRPQGFVDQAGLIRVYPESFSKDVLVRFPDAASAEKALKAGKISAFYIIPRGYEQSGKLSVYMQEYNVLSAGQRSQDLVDLIDFNLLGGNTALTRAIRQPLMNIHEENISAQPETEREIDNGLAFFVPYGMVMLFFISIIGSASLMLSSLAKEKENRILEILMISATPHQLLLGKIAGLGLVGLFQIMIWATSAVTLLQLSGQTFQLPAEFLLHPSILAWGAVFYLLGYLVYATLMAGVGALVPNLREASQASFLITLPMMVPLFLISALIQSPGGALATAFSLFPFTAPTTMMLRLAAGSVPLWQLLLSILLLAATGLLIIRAVAGMFRAQTILSGQAFNLKRLFLALAGKL